MRITTWNINGVKARIEPLVAWLRAEGPDVVCLQEIKSVDEGFPRAEIEAAGYNVATVGQKGFNGVAVLARRPFEVERRALPGDTDDVQARYLEVVVPTDAAAVRIACLYLPNGNPVATDKFAYKQAWMERLIRHAATLLDLEEAVVVAGDYNIIPEPRDAKRPEVWVNDALFQPQSRDVYAALTGQGYLDAVRAATDAPGPFTFWDYQAGAFQKDDGIRIDHCLLSPEAADRLVGVAVERQLRAGERPSDHVPVTVELAL